MYCVIAVADALNLGPFISFDSAFKTDYFRFEKELDAEQIFDFYCQSDGWSLDLR